MNRKYRIVLEIEMPDDSTADYAHSWAISMLETAFKKPNPSRPVPYEMRKLGDRKWEPEVAMAPSEHPYRPRVVEAHEVAQPLPRLSR